MTEPFARPRDKVALLRQMEAGMAGLRDAVAGIPADRRGTIRDAGGWSVADHLSHVAAWERWKVAALRGESRAESLGVPAETYASDDTDAINAAVHAATAKRSLDEAMADLEATHAGLTAIVSALSDEDLSQRYGDRFPDQSAIEGEIEGDPVLLDLCAYTLEHIAEHIDMLTSMRSA